MNKTESVVSATSLMCLERIWFLAAPWLRNPIRFTALLIAGLASVCGAQPYIISSGSGSFSTSATIEGVLMSGASGNRNNSRYSTTFTGFQWDGSMVVASGGDTYGLVNQTNYNISFPQIKLSNSMIFDAGSGGFSITNWNSDLQGNDIIFRADDAQVSITGSVQSTGGAGNMTIESGVTDFSAGGPMQLNGGSFYFYGGGDVSMNGVSLNGGDFIWDADVNSATFGSTSLDSQGGDISFSGTSSASGTSDFTFNGQILTNGGSFSWDVEGDALFKNNINAGAGQINLTGDGTLTFNNPVSTTSLTGTITIGGSQNIVFSNTVSTNGGSITIEDGASVDAQNTVNTGGGDFVVQGGASLTTHNTVNTGGGDFDIDTSGDVTVMSNVSTNGGAINVTGSGSTSFDGWVDTGNGNIVLSGDGDLAFDNDPNLGTGEIIVIGSGTLILDADGTGSNTSGTRINVILQGGTFRTAGEDRYIDSLTLNAESRIDMGSSTSTMDINTLAFENDFNPYDGTSLITVENWTSGSDSILFNSDVTASAGYFRFEGDYGSGYGTYYGSVTHIGGGVYELTPGAIAETPVVPEPEVLPLLGAILGSFVWWHHRRRKSQSVD